MLKVGSTVWCSVTELAEIANVSRQAVWNWVKDGRLRTRRVGAVRFIHYASARVALRELGRELPAIGQLRIRWVPEEV